MSIFSYIKWSVIILTSGCCFNHKHIALPGTVGTQLPIRSLISADKDFKDSSFITAASYRRPQRILQEDCRQILCIESSNLFEQASAIDSGQDNFFIYKKRNTTNKDTVEINTLNSLSLSFLSLSAFSLFLSTYRTRVNIVIFHVVSLPQNGLFRIKWSCFCYGSTSSPLILLLSLCTQPRWPPCCSSNRTSMHPTSGLFCS